MKKKSLYFILFLSLIGLFIPKNAAAFEEVLYGPYYGPYIDYRFYVEDEKGNNVENLKFKLHDVNNYISYESNYDSDNKVYYFNKTKYGFNSLEEFEEWFNTIPSEWVPNGFKEELIDNITNQNWNQKAREIASRYPNIEATPIRVGEQYNLNIRIFMPMILEEISGSTESTIKKIIFAELILLPTPIPTPIPNSSEVGLAIAFELDIINNTCYMYENQMTATIEEQSSQINPTLISIRKNAFDYNEELINHFSSLNFTSPEINSNNYLNKCGNKIRNIETNEPTPLRPRREDIDNQNQQFRSSEDNVTETTVSDYCECLPVFIQKRKENILINPTTWNTGFVALLLSMITAVSGSFILIKKKS